MVLGSTIIHEDVFKEIVRLLLEEMEEVYVYEPRGPLAPFLGEKAVKPVINVYVRKPESVEDEPAEETAAVSADLAKEAGEEQADSVAVEVKVALLYGASIPQTVAKIRREIAERIKRYTGYTTEKIDVYITRLIRFEDERSEQDNGEETTGNNPDEGNNAGTGGEATDSN